MFSFIVSSNQNMKKTISRKAAKNAKQINCRRIIFLYKALSFFAIFAPLREN